MNLSLTKNQHIILEILFNNPEKEYYLNELAKIIDKKPGVFQRGINELVERGLLLSFYRQNRRFFQLNKEYPLYKELKSIFFKTTGVEGTFKKAFGRIDGIKRAFIYGSYAEEKEKATSDVDLFIVGKIDENVLIDCVSKLEDKFSKEINYVLMSEEEFEQKKKNNSFIKNVLNHKKIEIL